MLFDDHDDICSFTYISSEKNVARTNKTKTKTARSNETNRMRNFSSPRYDKQFEVA